MNIDPLFVLVVLMIIIIASQFLASMFLALVEYLKKTVMPALIISIVLIGLSIIFNGCH